MIKELFQRFRRLITYGIVGGVNTLVDFCVYSVMLSLVGLSPWLCQNIGYLAGVLCSFILNHNVTFRDGTRRFGPEFTLFIIVNGVSLLLSILLIKWLTGAGINEYVAKVMVTGVVMVVNYFGYKLLVFKIKPDKGK